VVPDPRSAAGRWWKPDSDRLFFTAEVVGGVYFEDRFEEVRKSSWSGT